MTGRSSTSVRRSRALPMVALGALALTMAACSSAPTNPSSGGTGTAAPVTSVTSDASTPASSPTPATSSASASSPPASAAAAPTSYDPCRLVTAAQASTLFGGGTFRGKEESLSGGTKECIYSSGLQVLTVQVATAASATAAQSVWTQEEARVPQLIANSANAPAALHLRTSVKDLSGYGDRAALLSGSGTVLGRTISASGIYLLKGPTFVGFEGLALGSPAPSSSALEAQATTVVAQLG